MDKILWRIERNCTLIPMVSVKGIIPGKGKKIKYILLEDALEFIEIGNLFQGRLLENPNYPSQLDMEGVIISFEIIFPGDLQINGFLEVLNELSKY